MAVLSTNLRRVELLALVNIFATSCAAHVEGSHQAYFVLPILPHPTPNDFRRVEVGGIVLVEDCESALAVSRDRTPITIHRKLNARQTFSFSHIVVG